MSTAGQGSAGNVLAAFASLVIPGLGQLLQGRIIAAISFFLISAILWLVTLGTFGWIGNLFACYSAAVWRGPRR